MRIDTGPEGYAMELIDGVRLKRLSIIEDARGWLMEVLRDDDEVFERFGQVYVTTAFPGVVKAWHAHRLQRDNFTCIRGTMRVALFDPRDGSPTKGRVNEFVIPSTAPILLSVPPEVYHGFRAEGDEMAYMLSIPTRHYDHDRPDEYRLPPDTPEIPYRWELTPGLVHG